MLIDVCCTSLLKGERTRLEDQFFPVMLLRNAVLRRPSANAPLVMQRPAAQVCLRRPAAEVVPSTGPLVQAGTRTGSARRQYCWWITFSFPYEDTVANLGLQTPAAFTRQSWADVVRDVHDAAGISLHEMVIFKEFHERTDASGQRLPHYNALVRSDEQYAWRRIACLFHERHSIRIDFSEHIRTWYDGLLYGAVESEHKPAEELDNEPFLWAISGTPTPIAEQLPKHLRGGRRQTKLTPMQAYDLCVEKSVIDVPKAFAVAKAMERQGDRGFLAFLLDCRDIGAFVGKVVVAQECEDIARREALGRVGLLREAAAAECTCPESSLWLRLARDTLQRNFLDGPFQKHIADALAYGRAKKRNVFLLGPTNAGKSFLIKPLTLLFRTYSIPDSGSYQLEMILDKEVIYLNDFTWDERWLKWQFLKTFLEGDAIQVGLPKNRGGNVVFKRDSPVIGSCCAPVQLFNKGGKAMSLNVSETQQMQSRITYLIMQQPVPAESLVECPACAHCAATLYLEGLSSPLPGLSSPAFSRARSRSPRRIFSFVSRPL